MAGVKTMSKNSLWWIAPEYFSRWRLFPRAFISMYIYLLWKVVTWFMALEAPTMEQAGLVSVINSSSTKFESVEVKTTMSGSEAKLEDKREAPKKKPAKKIDNSKYDNDY